MTRVIIETGDGHKVTVEQADQVDPKARDVLTLVYHAMLAKGYQDHNIEQYLPSGPLLDEFAPPSFQVAIQQ